MFGKRKKRVGIVGRGKKRPSKSNGEGGGPAVFYMSKGRNTRSREKKRLLYQREMKERKAGRGMQKVLTFSAQNWGEACVPANQGGMANRKNLEGKGEIVIVWKKGRPGRVHGKLV